MYPSALYTAHPSPAAGEEDPPVVRGAGGPRPDARRHVDRRDALVGVPEPVVGGPGRLAVVGLDAVPEPVPRHPVGPRPEHPVDPPAVARVHNPEAEHGPLDLGPGRDLARPRPDDPVEPEEPLAVPPAPPRVRAVDEDGRPAPGDRPRLVVPDVGVDGPAVAAEPLLEHGDVAARRRRHAEVQPGPERRAGDRREPEEGEGEVGRVPVPDGLDGPAGARTPRPGVGPGPPG